MNHSKIRERHLERQSYVYIRQSPLRQVEENLESQDLQYQLAHRARAFGWMTSQVQVIDHDLAKSGTSILDRAWFFLMLHSGLRTCEIRTLRLSDFDWDGKRVRIQQSRG